MTHRRLMEAMMTLNHRTVMTGVTTIMNLTKMEILVEAVAVEAVTMMETMMTTTMATILLPHRGFPHHLGSQLHHETTSHKVSPLTSII